MRPGFSITAEQTVLGGLLLNEATWQRVADIVNTADFYRRDHQHIFAAIAKLATRGELFDAVSVAEYLDSRGQYEDAGGLRYLARLVMQTASTTYIDVYARTVANCARCRRIRAAAARVAAGDFEALAELLQVTA